MSKGKHCENNIKLLMWLFNIITPCWSPVNSKIESNFGKKNMNGNDKNLVRLIVYEPRMYC